MPTNPNISVNEGHTATVIPSTAIPVGCGVGFNGEIAEFDALIYGVAKFDGLPNQPLTIITSNEAIVRLDATITAAGQALTPSLDGGFQPNIADGNVSLRALQTGVAGDYIRALIVR